MAQRLPAAMVELARKMAVLERAATPDDIADQVLAFCRSDSVTGQVLPIDAGIFRISRRWRTVGLHAWLQQKSAWPKTAWRCAGCARNVRSHGFRGRRSDTLKPGRARQHGRRRTGRVWCVTAPLSCGGRPVAGGARRTGGARLGEQQ